MPTIGTFEKLAEVVDFRTVLETFGISVLNAMMEVKRGDLTGESSRQERVVAQFAKVSEGGPPRARRAMALMIAAYDFEVSNACAGHGMGVARTMADCVDEALATLEPDGDRAPTVLSTRTASRGLAERKAEIRTFMEGLAAFPEDWSVFIDREGRLVAVHPNEDCYAVGATERGFVLRSCELPMELLMSDSVNPSAEIFASVEEAYERFLKCEGLQPAPGPTP